MFIFSLREKKTSFHVVQTESCFKSGQNTRIGGKFCFSISEFPQTAGKYAYPVVSCLWNIRPFGALCVDFFFETGLLRAMIHRMWNPLIYLLSSERLGSWLHYEDRFPVESECHYGLVCHSSHFLSTLSASAMTYDIMIGEEILNDVRLVVQPEATVEFVRKQRQTFISQVVVITTGKPMTILPVGFLLWADILWSTLTLLCVRTHIHEA